MCRGTPRIHALPQSSRAETRDDGYALHVCEGAALLEIRPSLLVGAAEWNNGSSVRDFMTVPLILVLP